MSDPPLAQTTSGHQEKRPATTPPSTRVVEDARELQSSESKQLENFPKKVFSDDTTSTKIPSIKKQSSATLKITTRQAAQTEEIGIVAATQTELSMEIHETYEYCVSRLDPNHCSQEELVPKCQP